MPWFHERPSNKFFYLTRWWTVTDVWELSQPFTKISLLCFTRSKGLGNGTLKELWQREQWMSRKWKGLVACSSTDSVGAVWGGTLIVLASPLPGEEWIPHCSTSPRKHSQSPPVGLSMGAEYVTLLFSACTHCSSTLMSWEFISSLICIFTYKKILWSSCIKYLIIHMQVVPSSYKLYWKHKLYSVLLCTFKGYIIALCNILFVWLFQLFIYYLWAN